MNVRSIIGLAPLALAIADAPATSVATFQKEREAEQHCPTDLVVWLDPPTRTYFYRGQARYGSTKGGAFVCRTEADHAGMRKSRGSQ